MFDIQHAMNQSQEEKPLPAIFFKKARQNIAESEAKGRAIYDEVVYIKIIFPGDKRSEIEREASDIDKQKYKAQYDAFLQGEEQRTVGGTPLNEWPVMTLSKIAELQALKIYTVEELAHLDDNGIGRLGMGGRDLVSKAQGWLALASGTADIQKLHSENVRLKESNESLSKQLNETNTRLDQLEKLVSQNGQNVADDKHTGGDADAVPAPKARPKKPQ